MFVRMADAYDQLPEGLSASDGDGIAVTADPQLATEMQRTALAGIYKELLETPVVFNPMKVGLRLLQTLRVPKPEELIAPPQTPQLTPDEKMKGVLGVMKHQNDKIKITGQVAVQLTQAMLNMVQAAGGMQDSRMALLTMAQLEQAVKSMVEDANNANGAVDGMASQSGNGNVPGLPAPSQGDASAALPGGSGAGGPDTAGAGGGTA